MLGVKNRYVKDEDGKRTFLSVKVTSKKKTQQTIGTGTGTVGSNYEIRQMTDNKYINKKETINGIDAESTTFENWK